MSRLFIVLGRALTVALAVFLSSNLAHAAGRVEWGSKTLKERTDSKSWKVEVKIFLPKAPDVAHVPMKFEFQPVAYFERNLVDGSEEVQQRTVPLSNQQSLIESVDVGFMDPGSGEIQNRTKFSFKLTRAHGYEAGEYKVTIRDIRDDKMIGQPTTLKFEGENEVIDRRSIVFTGKKEKKDEKKSDAPAAEKKEEAAPSDTPASDQPDPEPTTAPEPTDEGQVPPSVEEKPGGCGCRQAPSSGGPLLWVASLAVVGAFVLRRRFAQAA
jgi:MYXO-CTERM domain-containing protein